MNEEAELTQTLIRNACVNDGDAPAGEIRNADIVRSLLTGSGFDVEHFDAEPGRRSIVARLPGTRPDAPALMLLGHTDVVPADPERWTRDPFAAELVEGVIWGRGALDMLGHVATMSLAARDYARTGRHRGGDIVVAMVADEEALGSRGMGWLVDAHRDAVRADWVVTETGGTLSGSPEDRRLSVMAAEKGAWRVRLHVLGQPGHTSMPLGSENAVVTAAEAVARIGRFAAPVVITDPWRAFVEAGWADQARTALQESASVDLVVGMLPDFAARVAHSLTRMTLVPTSVRSASSWNTIPAAAVVELDVRTLPGDGEVEITAAIGEALGDLADRVRVELVAGMPANGSPPDTDLWRLMQDASGLQTGRARLIPTMASGVTDARFMRAIGATAYGFGLSSGAIPVEEIPRMLHGDDERVDLQTLGMMRRLWGDMLAMFADRSDQSTR